MSNVSITGSLWRFLVNQQKFCLRSVLLTKTHPVCRVTSFYKHAKQIFQVISIQYSVQPLFQQIAIICKRSVLVNEAFQSPAVVKSFTQSCVHILVSERLNLFEEAPDTITCYKVANPTIETASIVLLKVKNSRGNLFKFKQSVDFIKIIS